MPDRGAVGGEWFDRPDPTGRTSTGEVGLRFACTTCGNCCSGPPGYVLFTEREAASIARRLGVTPEAFVQGFTVDTPAGRSLAEVPSEHGNDCVFLDRTTSPGRALCRIYEDRPAQCRTWPFWRSNLTSATSWRRASTTCPGMNTGELHEPAAIRLTRDRVDI